MKFLKYTALAAALLSSAPTWAVNDSEGYPIMYLKGDMTDNWSAKDDYKFTRSGNTYTLHLSSLNGTFKVSDAEWKVEYGAVLAPGTTKNDPFICNDAISFYITHAGANIQANNLNDVTITFDLVRTGNTVQNSVMRIAANGKEAPTTIIDPSQGGGGGGDDVEAAISGTLPVLYINVYNEGTTDYNNEIISANLDHKNYFSGVYWLETNGCQWLEDLGAKNVGSKEEPLPLEIKARGNFTRKAFAKKPFKLKLGAKQSLLGLSKSKHFAIIAHADDNYGYLRNFTGFNLGRRIGLPWTPWQQPVEVVINGNYRGLYFLTESIRIEKDRVNITELDDDATENGLISGGYLVELDNYEEENQTRITQKYCEGDPSSPKIPCLWITWDTPESYSELQQRFVKDQFTAMNDAVGANSNDLWKYLDLDDAARYYIVEEIISHTESYHGSTYMFRDRGEGQKWHFSPLWDCGNAFNGATDNYFYCASPFGNTWIGSMSQNQKFRDKVKETWAWFMNNGYKGLTDDIDEYVNHISEAAKSDRARWKDAPRPTNYEAPQGVIDNSDMQARKNAALDKLNSKINWLKNSSYFGDYATMPDAQEPARDNTEAAPLPLYATEVESVDAYFIDNDTNPWQKVYAYIWTQGDTTQPLGAWPGTEMERTTVEGKEGWKISFYPEEVLPNFKIIFNNGSNGGSNQTESFDFVTNGIYDRNGQQGTVGIDAIEFDIDNSSVEYFNLQGIRIANPSRGNVYIINRDGKTSKELKK